MRYLVLILFFISTVFAASAQVVKLSSDPAQFISEISPLMAATNNENAMKVASMFEMAWTSGNINESQKARIIAFAQGMQAKKMRTRPHLENFFGAIGSAVNVHRTSGAQLNQLLDVIDKTYEREDPKAAEQFMASAYRFLDTKTLFRDKFTALRVVGGEFSFEYRYGNEVDEPEPVKAEPKKSRAGA
ncbi:MAG TPA: hypothetical protein VK927_03025 [Adhaeribacter sp.]|nr:hypothetical protein [Adhaeribacter sp.]